MRAAFRGLPARHRGLAVLLLAGLALRVWLSVLWRPAFVGFSDSAAYLSAAEGNWFHEPLRTVGYPVVLWALRLVSDSFAWIVGVQHLLGLAAAAAAYAAMLRLGAPRWAALAPAAVVALHGTLISLEHTVLAESVFVALVLAGLLAAVYAATTDPGRRAFALAALAGLALAAAGAVRTAGLPLVVVGALYLAWAGAGVGARTRLLRGGSCLAVGAALLGTNLVLAHDATGSWSFAWRDAYQSYGRVAPFADCSRFEPPAGTEALCPTLPVAERHGPSYWLYDAASPLLQRYGGAHGGSATPDDLEDISAFTRSAILGQSWRYLETVGRDLVRVVDPDFPLNPNPAVGNAGAGYLPAGLLAQLVDPGWQRINLAWHRGMAPHQGDIGWWGSYHRVTSLVGLPTLLALLAAALAPFVLGGERRKAALLYGATAAVLLVLPILGLSWNWRYQVAAFPVLASAAALGVWGGASRWRRA